MLELVHMTSTFVEMLLDEREGLNIKGGLALLLKESGSGEGLKKTTSLSDDGNSLFVLLDLAFEFLVGFISIVIELIDILVEALGFVGLGVDDTGEDGSLGIELSL